MIELPQKQPKETKRRGWWPVAAGVRRLQLNIPFRRNWSLRTSTATRNRFLEEAARPGFLPSFPSFASVQRPSTVQFFVWTDLSRNWYMWAWKNVAPDPAVSRSIESDASGVAAGRSAPHPVPHGPQRPGAPLPVAAAPRWHRAGDRSARRVRRGSDALRQSQ